MTGVVTGGHGTGRFMAAHPDPGAPVVLIGAPMDVTTSFRPGARFAPSRIREVSDGLEEYSPALQRELAETPFFDAGDIEFPFGSSRDALDAIEASVRRVAGNGQFPLVLGGEHLLTLGAVRALHAAYPDLVLVQIDAHADLRDDYLGQRLSHATVVRRISELIGAERVHQLGIRSGTREEFQFGHNFTRFYPLVMGGSLQDAVAEVVDVVGGRPVFVTLDIDVVDPAFAPGTGTPEPGGVSPAELFQALYGLQRLHVVGMDIVEVCPPQDSSDITSMLAAKLVREAILSFGYNFARRGREPLR